ncbi:MAG: S9 family peptidase [Deltaproteobacteria bacterium]|nr:S9 family peptidase [Deltaproteobacteria bacterium]
MLSLVLVTLGLAGAEAPAPPPIREVGNLVYDGIPEIPATIGERTRPYAATRPTSVFAWSAFGARLLVGTRYGEVTQVHETDGPGRQLVQRTFIEEPVAGAATDPSRPDGFWFSADKGGREAWQFWWLDGATGRTTLLTDGLSRNEGIVVAPRGGRFAFASNRRNGKDFDLWILTGSDPASARMVMEGEGQWNALGWAPDEGRLLAKRYVSITRSSLWEVDVATGARTTLTPDAEGTAVGGGAWLADGSLLYTTDAGVESARLVRRGADGATQVVYADARWPVEGLAVSPDQRQVAWTVNEGGASALYLARADRLAKPRRVVLPLGVVGGMDFDPAGTRLAISLNTPTSPGDVWTVDTRRGALTRWTTAEVGGLPEAAFLQPELRSAPSFDGREVPYWLTLPRAASPERRAPVILVIHGGPEGQTQATFSPNIQYWANELRAAVIAPNVRGSTGYGRTWVDLDNGRNREDSVRDIGAILDAVAKDPRLDAGRVAVTGGSYGGYMTLATLVHYGDRVRCGVDSVGISNFVTFLRNTEDYRRDLRRVEYGDERDPEMAAFLESISPLTNVARIRSPLLVVQGMNDPRVPVTEAEQIVRAVRGAGGTAWYLMAKDEGHGFKRKSNREALMDVTTRFFETCLLPTAGG